ncbi:MAG: insulinase family protein [Acidobacteriia bacterium]|nr:insulinase family protein [Terriglobia bacterium]
MSDTERKNSARGPRSSLRASGTTTPPAVELEASLPVSPDVETMTLPNGFSCWIRHHPRPARAASLCLHVHSGSLDEEDHERGISHLLEHMAFRGSANFPPGALQELFASLGTRVGRHHNASTGFDHTSFTLSVPDADDRTLDTFVLCQADFAYRLSLLPEEVERERRVVLEEMRAYPRSEARLRERILGLLLPGSRLAARQPLGTEPTLKALTAEQLRAHCLKWHRPDNSTLLVVGDVDVGRVKELVHRHFDDWPPVADPPPSAQPDFRPALEARAAVIQEPEVAETEVRVLTVLPPAPLRTVGDFRARLVERLAVWLLNRQINTLVREGKAIFRDAQVSLSPLGRACTLARATANGPPDRIEAMLLDLLVELKRAGSYPHAAAELARGRAALLTGARQAATSEHNRRSESLLTELEQTLVEGQVPLGKAHVARLVEVMLPGVTGEDVRDAIAASFVTPSKLIVAIVPGASRTEAPEPKRLLEILPEVQALPVGPVASRSQLHRLMVRRPTRGMVAALEDDQELGLSSATLSNGVRLHVRPMAYRRERVFVKITLAGGRLREVPENLGVTSAAALAWTEPATQSHSSVAIRDHLSGKALALDTRVEEDALEVHLAADPSDLEDGLQLVHLLLTRPRIEASALQRWQDRTRQHASTHRRSLEIQLAERTLALLTGGDPRFGLLTAAHVEAITLGGAQSWLDEVICPAPLEAAFVGDLSRDRMLDLALRYLGSLPARPLAGADLVGLRMLARVRGPLQSALTIEVTSPAAAVLVGWQAAPWQAVRERHVLQMAEQVLLRRIRSDLRETRGMSYSPEVSFNPSRAYPFASLLSTTSYAAPSRVEETIEILRSVAERLAADGPSEDEMTTVRKQFADLVEQSQKDPKYWCRVLADLDYHGTRLADLKELPRFFATCTGAVLREVLSGIVTEDRRIEVICLPSPV